MDVGIVAAGVVAGLSMTAAWLDLRRRTNGNGPLGSELRAIKADVREVRADIHELRADFRQHLSGDGR